MYTNGLKGILRAWGGSKQRKASRLSAAVLETLEQRQLLAFAVAHEPYLQLGNAPLVGSSGYGGNDQVEVIWQTSGSAGTGENFVAEYRQIGAPLWTSAGTPAVGTNVTVGAEVRNNRSVTVTGLSFDTDYEYRITWNKPSPASPVTYNKTFHTRLAPGSTSTFSFVAYGDSADGSGQFSSPTNSVIARITAINPRFSLLLGDNAYNDGSFVNMENRLNPANAGATMAAYIGNHIEYPAYGNHDVGNGGNPNSPNSTPPGAATDYSFSLPVPDSTHSPVPAPVGTLPEHNYSFDYGNVHFVSIEGNYCDVPNTGDTQCYNNNSAVMDAELDWAVNDLKESDAKWKIVIVHQPIFSLVGHTTLTAQTTYFMKMTARLGKDGAGADLVLSGHAHDYQRSYPIVGPYDDGIGHKDGTTGSSYTKGTGLVEVVSGLGGHSVDGGAVPALPSFMAKVLTGAAGSSPVAVASVLKIDVTSTVLTLSQVRADNGVALDTFTITAPNDTTAPTAFVAGPLDNSSVDYDADPDQVSVTGTQASFVIKLKDSGDGINDASVTSSAVSLIKDGRTLVSGTNYTFSYNSTTNRISLTAIGSPFDVGAYQIVINSGIISDSHGTPNVMGSKTMTVNIDESFSTTPLIAKGGAWHYFSETRGASFDPFTIQANFANWYKNTYTESGWTTAPNTSGPLGYGVLNDLPDTQITPRSIGTVPADGNKYTVYFRRTFNVSEPSKVASLVLNLLRDDGAVVYLNNTEVIRTSNLNPSGTLGFTALANFSSAPAVGGAAESAYFPFRINPSLLVTGTNLIAVELHQQANNSSDIGFDLELLGPSPNMTCTFVSGALTIKGTTQNDQLDVSSDGTQVTVHGVPILCPSAVAPSAVTSITVLGRAGNDTISLTDVSSVKGFNPAALSGNVTARGEAGNDSIAGVGFFVAWQVNDWLYGGDGPDSINGGIGYDLIFGEEGNDILHGGDVRDEMLGGNGDDAVYGDAGDDIIFGEGGNDVLHGGLDHDGAYGGAGNDLIYGDEGNDRLRPGDQGELADDGIDVLDGGADIDVADYGNRTVAVNLSNDGVANDGKTGEGDNILANVENITSGSGNDRIDGNGDANVLTGNGGDDYILGYGGNDSLYGNAGMDWLTAGDGNDKLYGGADHDVAYGGLGNDEVYGEDGDDALHGGDQAELSDGNDSLSGGNGVDVANYQFDTHNLNLSLDGVANDGESGEFDNIFMDVENVYGGYGNDRIDGNANANLLVGSGGNDYLLGYGGNDTLYGNDGVDWLTAGDGNDKIYGGADHDACYGGLGNDEVYGEDGDDGLHGGDQFEQYDGDDSLSGGNGNDVADYQFDTHNLNLSIDGINNDGESGEHDNILTDVETIWGGGGNDVITGRVGYSNYLYGGGGNDMFYAGDGASDTIDGGPGTDTLMSWDGNDVWSNIEVVFD